MNAVAGTDPSTPCVTTGVTLCCTHCGTAFVASGRRRYCGDACRQAAWRQRHLTPPAPTAPARRADVVYQCPDCDTRYLGEQRCPDCNKWCRRLGPGAPCPHCDEPVTVNDLIDAGEAAT
jgi:hypothetical protein